MPRQIYPVQFFLETNSLTAETFYRECANPSASVLFYGEEETGKSCLKDAIIHWFSSRKLPCARIATSLSNPPSKWLCEPPGAAEWIYSKRWCTTKNNDLRLSNRDIVQQIYQDDLNLVFDFENP
jgi:GTPase SAR1 family protein